MRVGLGVVVVVGLTAATALGGPIPIPGWQDAGVTNIEVSGLVGTFTVGGGANGLGVYDVQPIDGGPVLTVHWDNGVDWTIPIANAISWATANLYSDASGIPPLLPTQAKGHFNGEGVGNPDWQLGYANIPLIGDVIFIEGTVVYWQMLEIGDTGFLEGGGRIMATGGLMATLGLWPSGGEESSISSFEFAVTDLGGNPLNISNFSQSFTGEIYLTFWPDDKHGIPEPVTFGFLAGGMALVALRRRR